MGNMEKKRLIISHGDGDGICACAIAYKALDENAVVVFSQPFDLHFMLGNLLYSGKIHEFHEMYIIDLACSEKTKKFLEEIETKTKCSICFIDHHKISLSIKGRYRGIINTEFSASTLTAHYFNMLTHLSKIGSASDKITMLSKLDDFYEEVELLRKAIAINGNDDKFRFEIMKELASGKRPSEIKQLVEKAITCEEERGRYMKDVLSKIVYKDDYIMIINANGMDIRGHAGSIASSIAIKENKMVFLIYGMKKTVITGRSHHKIKVDVGEFMRKYFKGGGHKNAGSALIQGDVDKIIIKIPEWFKRELSLYNIKEVGVND